MRHNQRGSGLLLVVMVFAALFAFIGFTLERSQHHIQSFQRAAFATAAENVTEAGIVYALEQVRQSNGTLQGQYDVTLDATGDFTITITPVAHTFEILATGKVHRIGSDVETTKTVRVVVQFVPENAERPFVLISRTDLS
jgi:hypothetical protein